jgi:hypothetical protein
MANVPSSPILVTLMMEALSSSEMLVLTRATGHHIPEDDILHSHRRENLRSYIIKVWVRESQRLPYSKCGLFTKLKLSKYVISQNVGTLDQDLTAYYWYWKEYSGNGSWCRSWRILLAVFSLPLIYLHFIVPPLMCTLDIQFTACRTDYYHSCSYSASPGPSGHSCVHQGSC